MANPPPPSLPAALLVRLITHLDILCLYAAAAAADGKKLLNVYVIFVTPSAVLVVRYYWPNILALPFNEPLLIC